MRVLAVDLGATSVRVATVDFTGRQIVPEVVHRWHHEPVPDPDGHLRWDWAGIVGELRAGIDAALDDGDADSIGVDGWGVDYGLLDADDRLVAAPFSYRDRRTDDWKTTANSIGADRLYGATGIQLMPINTVFQLAVHDRGELERAQRLLLLPDLLVHELCGYEGAERSNASTTALLNPRTGDWDDGLIEAAGVPRSLFPPVYAAGQAVGEYRGVPVHLVGSHDTASAVVAVPGVPGAASAFVSSGTWVLVGAERAQPDTSREARDANFSNELGALGGVRFLKNVMGFWMLEQCRAGWGMPPIEDLVAEAATVSDAVPVVDARDQRFLAPEDMETEIRDSAGLGVSASRAVVVRSILESIAAATAAVVDELGGFVGRRIEELFVVGGGARMHLMNELLAAHTGAQVQVGSPEAAALGNALVQGIALGWFEDLAEARRAIAS